MAFYGRGSPVTVFEAARVLGVSTARVHMFIKEGRLPAKKFGNTYAIQPEDIQHLARYKPHERTKIEQQKEKP